MKKALGILSVILLGLTELSCEKEEPTIARVKVVDTDGNACAGARVHLFGVPAVNPHGQVILDREVLTDSDGYAVFDFSEDYKSGCAGFAVLNIEVSASDELQSGEGIIKVEEEKHNEETVVIQP